MLVQHWPGNCLLATFELLSSTDFLPFFLFFLPMGNSDAQVVYERRSLLSSASEYNRVAFSEYTRSWRLCSRASCHSVGGSSLWRCAANVLFLWCDACSYLPSNPAQTSAKLPHLVQVCLPIPFVLLILLSVPAHRQDPPSLFVVYQKPYGGFALVLVIAGMIADCCAFNQNTALV